MTINIFKCFCLCDFSFILVILCLPIGSDLVTVTQPNKVISLCGYTSKWHGVPMEVKIQLWNVFGRYSEYYDPYDIIFALRRLLPFVTLNLSTISGCHFRNRTQIFYSNTASFLDSNFCIQFYIFYFNLTCLEEFLWKIHRYINFQCYPIAI